MIGIATNQNYDGAIIKVIGIGGGGGNAINNMVRRGLTGVEFIAANTDKQALDKNLANVKIQIGKDTTRGLGAGANPEVGHKSIEESQEQIKESIKGSDMVFVTSGMGGGTGTGGAPTVAKIAQEMGALVVAIVTKPFIWEGKKRMNVAEQWIAELRKNVDALIVIPNQRLLEIIDKDTTFNEAFLKVDEVLYNATKGIADIISQCGHINVDFADVQTVMKGMGDALMGIGVAEGENRAIEATKKALNSPLLDGISIEGAKGVLINITGGENLKMNEIAEAVSLVESAAGGEANVIHGIVYNKDFSDEIMVTVVATGFNKASIKSEMVSSYDKPVEQPLPYPSEHLLSLKGRFAGGKVAEKFTKFYEEPVKTSSTSPRGPNQLSKYDTPAMIRNGAPEILQKTENTNEELAIAEVETYEKDSITFNKFNSKMYDQPAFITKMINL